MTPAAPPRSNAALWAGVALVSAIAITALGIAVVRSIRVDEKHEARRTRANEAEDDESEPDLEGEIMKGVVKSLGSMGKCPPLSPSVAAFSVQGLTLEQLLARFVGAGYQCVTHNDFGRFGNFMLKKGAEVVTVHYGPKQLVMAKDLPQTRSLTDANGNVFVLQAATDREAAAAGEIAAGRPPSK